MGTVYGFVTPTIVTKELLKELITSFPQGLFIDDRPSGLPYAHVEEGGAIVWFEIDGTDGLPWDALYSPEEWDKLCTLFGSEPKSLIALEGGDSYTKYGKLLQKVAAKMKEAWGGGLEHELLPETKWVYTDEVPVDPSRKLT